MTSAARTSPAKLDLGTLNFEEDNLLSKLDFNAIDCSKNLLLTSETPKGLSPVDCNGPSWNDFTVDRVLGEGSFGRVYKVYRKLVA